MPPTDPAGDPPTPAPVGDPPAPPEPKQPTLEELQTQLADTQKALKAANHESAERRKRLEAIDAEEAKRKEAEKTDLQKAEERATQAEKDRADALAQADARTLRAEILAAAAGKFADPEDVVMLLSQKLTVTDGKVDGLADALKELEKTKPHWLKKTGAPNLGPTNPGGNGDQGETVEQKRKRLGLR